MSLNLETSGSIMGRNEYARNDCDMVSTIARTVAIILECQWLFTMNINIFVYTYYIYSNIFIPFPFANYTLKFLVATLHA
jgi:hypothetical protein